MARKSNAVLSSDKDANFNDGGDATAAEFRAQQQDMIDSKAHLDVTDALSTSVAGKANTVHTHTLAGITDAGTAAAADIGTSAGNVLVLDGSGRLPAVDGSQLTGLAGGGGASVTAEIESLQNKTQGITTPQDFAADPTFIGGGVGRRLSVDYTTIAEAQAAYPLVSSDISSNGDLTTISHDWCALQSMTRFAAAAVTSDEMRVPAGVYKITDTWKIAEGTPIRTFKVVGAGMGYNAPIDATVIDCTDFLDRPGISIQGCRSGSLSHLSVRGGNTAPVTIPRNARTPDAWITAGCASGRYNPYTGITIDGYTIDPGGGQGYPNGPYTTNKSSHVSIDHVRVERFVLAVGVSNSNDSQNADAINLDNCFIHHNTYALHSGGSQNRILTFQNGYIYGAYTCFSNKVFGQQNGNCWVVRNSLAILFFNLMQYNNSEAALFDCVHLEEFMRLGDYDSGNQAFPVVMRQCHIKPIGLSSLGNYRSADFFRLGDNAQAIFDACRFDSCTADGFPPYYNLLSYRGTFKFTNGCNFFPRSAATEDPIITWSYRGNRSPSFDTYWSLSNHPSASIKAARLTRHSEHLSFPNDPQSLYRMQGRITASASARTVSDASGRYFRYEVGLQNGTHDIGGVSNVAFSGDNLTFDTTDPSFVLVGDAFVAQLSSPADAISGFYQAPVGTVTSVSGNTVTVLLFCEGEELASPLAVPGIVAREWAPRDALVGTASSSSAVVSFGSDVSDIIYEGDCIQGTGATWTRYRVLTVAGDGLSITLNKNAPTDGSVNLFWGRLFELAGVAV